MTRRSWAGLAVLLFAIALPAAAQQPPVPPQPRAPGGPGAPGGMRLQGLNVEMALRMKEQLKLSDAQFSQLDAIRKEIVAERQQRAHDMIDIQSRLAAGLIQREDVRKQFEANRDAVQKVAQARHDRIAKILTTEQQDQLRRAERRMIMQRVRMNRGRMGPGGFGQGFGRGMMRPRRPFPPMGPGWDEGRI